MADEFHENMRGTIERCRRLAARTHDQEVAQKLQKLAEEMEAKLSQTTDGGGEAIRRNEGLKPSRLTVPNVPAIQTHRRP